LGWRHFQQQLPLKFPRTNLNRVQHAEVVTIVEFIIRRFHSIYTMNQGDMPDYAHDGR